MASLQALGSYAESLLEAFATQLVAFGVTPPAEQYVGAGSLVAWDGEHLAVTLVSIDQGQPGAPYSGTFQPGVVTTLAAQFTVEILREVPALAGEGGLAQMVPSQEALDAAGQISMNDAAGLVQAAIAIHDDSTMTPSGTGFAIGACTSLGPDGGLAGHRLVVTVSLL